MNMCVIQYPNFEYREVKGGTYYLKDPQNTPFRDLSISTHYPS